MNAEEAKEFYLKAVSRRGPDWASGVRQAARERFAEVGFPTTHDEEWKYTSVEPIVKTAFAPGRAADDGVNEAIAALGLDSLAGNRLVFVDGRFSQRLSRTEHLARGVIAGSLAAAMTAQRSLVEPHWTRVSDGRAPAFAALNTTLAEDGAFVYIPAGAVVTMPFHLMFIAGRRDEATVSHPRVLIVLERGSQATVIETYAGLDGDPYWTNGVTEIVVGDNAALDHYKIQMESERAVHVATEQARLGRDAVFISHSFALGGALVRNDVNAGFAGEGGDATLNGLYVTAGRQHVDNHTRIDHGQPRCTSRELYKGIMGEKSRGVFNGKIYVHEHAEKTDARQTNRNLLLSGEAWVDTKPQLEIYNNDVKCSHGSTIGQLDSDALFFLRARGLDLRAAIGLLTQGFANELTARLKQAPVAGLLEKVMARKIESMSGEEARW
ncbi:MAG TPA: Fe-S cluster assembly protein SufD [Verrucomicrobiae bacterium]|jgi:Fe-S cluster assembly protein SufD|nr:Fe-S cluster assembly protein SufD [Verrucomicrobiae bacterium]